VSHTYAVAGSYQVKLTVTDDGGLPHTTAHPVAVEEPVQVTLPPMPAISAPSAAAPGQPVAFDAGGSIDPDGRIVSYAWDFGDGITGSGITATHVYSQAGVYQVALTATDDDGLFDIAGHTLQVEEAVSPGPVRPRAEQPGQ
jgi:PKD repeat protein